MIGSVLLLAVFAVSQDGFGPLWSALGSLLSGHGADIERAEVPPSGMLPVLSAALIVKLVVALVAGVLVKTAVGRPAKAAPAASLSVQTAKPGGKGKDKQWWQTMTVRHAATLVILEELYARWLFLGVLAHFLHGNVMFYVLFLLGNGSWALIHRWNHADRKLARVIPQFLGGIVLTAVFARYGLAAAVVTHAAFNMLLWSTQRPVAVRGRVALLAYNIVLAVLAWLVIDHPLSDMLRWLRTDTLEALPGWDVGDYFCGVVFVCAVLTALAEILGYVADPTGPTGMLDDWRATAAMVPLAVLVFWLLGFLTDSAWTRTVVVAMVLIVVFAGSRTGHGLARVFWFDIPIVTVELYAVFALDSWWSAILLVVALYAVDAGDRLLRRLDVGIHRGRLTWKRV